MTLLDGAPEAGARVLSEDYEQAGSLAPLAAKAASPASAAERGVLDDRTEIPDAAAWYHAGRAPMVFG